MGCGGCDWADWGFPGPRRAAGRAADKRKSCVYEGPSKDTPRKPSCRSNDGRAFVSDRQHDAQARGSRTRPRSRRARCRQAILASPPLVVVALVTASDGGAMGVMQRPPTLTQIRFGQGRQGRSYKPRTTSGIRSCSLVGDKTRVLRVKKRFRGRRGTGRRTAAPDQLVAESWWARFY